MRRLCLLWVVFVSELLGAYLCNAAFSTRNEGAVMDVESLLAFKLSIKSDPYEVLSSWLSNSTTACQWKGIVCHWHKNPGRVVRIDLNNTGIRGYLVPHLANITFLQVLNLSHNHLLGRIPSSFGNLLNLEELYLSGNVELEGPIPHELGLLQKLHTFSSFKNGHTGNIPSSMFNCSHLAIVDLADNKLTGSLPSNVGSVGSASRLTWFNFDNNQLSGEIPLSILNCTNLGVLSLSLNMISGKIPRDIGKALGKLWWLGLNLNQLDGTIPDSLSNATSLSDLQLAANELGGEIPLWFGKLSSLQRLNLHYNYFTSGTSDLRPNPALEALSNCSKLQYLGLSSKGLRGTIPESIGLLSDSLMELVIMDSSISGRIPSSIGNLTLLYLLDLQENMISGTIPSTIGGMKSLQAIFLTNNRIQGGIPETICNLNKSLSSLFLNRNRLSGSIPEFLGNMGNLRELSIGGNSFIGNIPPEIISYIPSEIIPNKLEYLDLSSNKLVGSIPPKISLTKNDMNYLNLSRNSLSGEIPHEIGELSMALAIDLSYNNLSGFITDYMENWLSLQLLDLSYNRFSGVLPETLGEKLPQLMLIDLAHNNFSGTVPLSLAKLQTLLFLNISNNNFEGNVTCVGALKQLDNTSFQANPLLQTHSCLGPPTSNLKSSCNSKLPFWLFHIIVPLLFIAALIAIFTIVIKKRKHRKGIWSVNSAVHQFLYLTKEDLYKATEGFSPNNLIGEGSFGRVYAGYIDKDIAVAVKVFRDISMHRSFMRECKTLGQIRHRNLLRILTACSSGNFKALVFPLMTNGTLDNLMHGREGETHIMTLPLRIRIRILRELASALSYLHHDCQPPVLHCDVKPQNVLLDSDMTVHLSDFGIAKLLPQVDSNTSSFIGSIGYMAPEYGTGTRPWMAGDVYSYGVVVLEMLTRKRPTDAMFLNDMTMPEWVRSAIFRTSDEQDGMSGLKMVLDEELMMSLENEEENAVYVLARLGAWCTCDDPDLRPTMRQVEDVLAKLLVTHHISNVSDNYM